MNCKLNSNSNKYQDIKINPFHENLSLSDLKNKLNNMDGIIYYYIIKSVDYENNRFNQRGSGPNFEGGVITLCTCKHRMRTYPDIKENTWIAGITRKYYKSNIANNSLFYLAQIKNVYNDYNELITSLPQKVIKYKSVITNQLGDIYIPLNGYKNLHSIKYYHTPIKGHSHYDNWEEDVGLYRNNNRVPKIHKLMVFERSNSFIWEEPIIHLIKSNIGIGQSKTNLLYFIANLIK